MCSIYKVTNKVNGKVYVGQTWQTIKERWLGHVHLRGCPKFSRAIAKYGAGSFDITLLTVVHTQACADHWESYFIERYDSIRTGYNLREGGARGKHSEETKRKLSGAKRGHRLSDDERRKRQVPLDEIQLRELHAQGMSATKIAGVLDVSIETVIRRLRSFGLHVASTTRGMKHSAETLEKLQQVNIGRRHSSATLAKMSESAVARSTPEYRAKMAQAARRVWKNPERVAKARGRSPATPSMPVEK